MSRKIIHLDLDAFYAAVEQRDDPELRGLPVIVGGSAGRGVVCACSYEARPYGVRSAMAMARALYLCPQARVLPVRMARYRQVSRQVFAIFGRYTDCLEPLSIDEAFLDVSGCERLFGPARMIAERIRAEVWQELGLRVSAGVAPNKFLAKLACESGKPDGLVEVPAAGIDSFLLPLPVASLWGVGQVTAKRLEGLGLRRVADLRQAGRQRLVRLLGSAAGEHLYRLACGEDERPVEPGGELKSVGHEETFERDLWRSEELDLELLALAERVGARLRGLGLVGRCLTLKVKYADFQQLTRSHSQDRGLSHAGEIHRLARELLGRTEAGGRAVRLLGLSLSSLERTGVGQGELFDGERRARQQALDAAVDQLRERFGSRGVQRASLLGRGKSRSTTEKGGDGSE